MAVPGVGIVADPVRGQAEEQVRSRLPFGGDPGGEHVLVVMLVAGVEILAIAVALQPGDRAADAERVADRQSHRADQVDLVVAAIGRPHPRVELMAEPAGDVFERAADRVAAVERALRPAQHLDPLDVEDVEHRRLRARDIDVVDIEADAGLEAPERVLLADAADEADQGRVGAARDLQRSVRRALHHRGEVDRALVLERLAVERGDRDRHVLQALRAAAGGDDDIGVARSALLRAVRIGERGLFLRIGGRRLVLGESGGSKGGQRDQRRAELQAGDAFVHGRSPRDAMV